MFPATATRTLTEGHKQVSQQQTEIVPIECQAWNSLTQQLPLLQDKWCGKDSKGRQGITNGDWRETTNGGYIWRGYFAFILGDLNIDQLSYPNSRGSWSWSHFALCIMHCEQLLQYKHGPAWPKHCSFSNWASHFTSVARNSAVSCNICRVFEPFGVRT